MVSRNDNDALTISFEQPVRDSHQEFRCLSVLPREFVGEVWRTSLCTVDKVAANDANRRLRNRRVVAWVTLHHISDKGFEKRRVAQFVGQIAMQVRDMKNREFHVARLPQ